MSDIRPRIRLPATAAAGSVIEVRTLLNHPMESGNRMGPDGALVPRRIINRFTCDYNDVRVIEVDIEPGVSANPFLEFDALVPASGTFVFTWHDDDGSVYVERAEFTVV